VWIGLMGLAGALAVYGLLRLFPRAFSDSGPAVAWPWQSSSGRSDRARGWLLVAAILVSGFVALTGLVEILFQPALLRPFVAPE